MAVVRIRYYGGGSVRRGVEYITHREESIPGGRRRPLYGLGERFRAMPLEPTGAAAVLERDGARVPGARWYRLHLTVDDQRAALLQQLAPSRAESVLRVAVERTMRTVLPLAEGVYVTHSHSTLGRRFGHPHVHVHLSPRGRGGAAMRIDRRRLVGLREAWERAVDRAVSGELTRRALVLADRGAGKSNAVLRRLAALKPEGRPADVTGGLPAGSARRSGIDGGLANALADWSPRRSGRERSGR
jgi:hypothetical protein